MIVILAAVLGISFFTDIASRRILNIVTFPAMLLGFLYYTLAGGLEGFLFSGAGFLTGLAVLFIPFALGGMGAGDVKLMAAVGALAGTGFVLATFVLGAIIGGFLALFILLKKQGLLSSMKAVFYFIPFIKGGSLQGIRQTAKTTTMPYGVSIVLGAVMAYAGGFGL
nr:prepilin peptidase [Alkalicoccus halolimnae]